MNSFEEAFREAGHDEDDPTEIDFVCSRKSGEWKTAVVARKGIDEVPCIQNLLTVIRCVLESEMGVIMTVDEES